MSKTAVVTGGAQGIGQGIAEVLLEQGYACIILDNNQSLTDETVKELSKFGNCRGYVADITDPSAITKFITWLSEESIEVDNLINNIGIEGNSSVLDLNIEDARQVDKTNLEGPYLLTSLLTKLMVEKKLQGNIVFITSVHSQVPRSDPTYSSSKAAIEMFVKEAALELAPYKIRVNSVAPGPVDVGPQKRTNEYVPLGEFQQPHDIGEGVAFLLSEKARYITGQTLVIDGGFSIAHTHYWKKHGKL